MATPDPYQNFTPIDDVGQPDANAALWNNPMYQLSSKIGKLANLTTANKSTLVGAIDEVAASGASAVSAEVVAARGGYGNLDARLDAMVVGAGVLPTALYYPQLAGAVGDGSTDDRAALNTLVNSTIPAGGGAVWIDRPYRVASNLTIPANVQLSIARPGMLKVDTGVTLTIAGHIDAGLYQVFNCTGTGAIVLAEGGVPEVYPEWWGAAGDCDPDDPEGSPGTDDSLALTKCFSSGVGPFKLSRFYRFATDLMWTCTSGQTFVGRGWRSGIFHDSTANALEATAAANGFIVEGDVANVHFENFYICGRQTMTGGTPYHIDSHSGYNIRIEPTAAGTPHDVRVVRCRLRNGYVGVGAIYSQTSGYYGAYNIQIDGCQVINHEHGIMLGAVRGANVSNVETAREAGVLRMQRPLFLDKAQDVNVSNCKLYGGTVVSLLIGGAAITAEPEWACKNINVSNVDCDYTVYLDTSASGVDDTAGLSNLNINNLTTSGKFQVVSEGTGVTYRQVRDVNIRNVICSYASINRASGVNIDGLMVRPLSSDTGVRMLISDSDNLRLLHCDIAGTAGGDCLSLNGANGGCSNIVIRDSTFHLKRAVSYAHGINFLTSSGAASQFDDILIEGCRFLDEAASGTQHALYVQNSRVTRLKVVNCYANTDRFFYIIDTSSDLRGGCHGRVLRQENTQTGAAYMSYSTAAAFVGQGEGELLGAPGIAKGSTLGKIKFDNPISYRSGDAGFKYKAATDDFWNLTGFTDLTAGQYVKVLLAITAAGAASAIMGTPAATLADSKWGKLANATDVIVGYFTIGDGTNAHDWSAEALDTHGGAFYDGCPTSL